MGLKYDKLKEYPDYLVHIRNSKSGEVIEGLIDNEDFSYSTAATIDSSYIAATAEGFTKGLVTAAAGRAAGDIGKNAVESNYKTVASTYKSFSGASDSPISITMHIFPGDNSYSSILEKIFKFTQPNTENNFLLNSYLYSPEDAAKLLKAEDPFKGQLIHVSIGKWFLATGMFCTGSSHSFSKYVDTYGKPLYMIWSSTFIPYKLLNAKELAAWHKK